MDHQILWHLLAPDTTSSPSPFPFLVQKSLLLLLEGKSHPRTHSTQSPHFLSDSPTGSGSAHSPAPSSEPLPRLHPHTSRQAHTPILLLDYSLSSSEIPSRLQPVDLQMPCHLCVEHPSPFFLLSQPPPCHASHFNLIKIFISQRNLP